MKEILEFVPGVVILTYLIWFTTHLPMTAQILIFSSMGILAVVTGLQVRSMFTEVKQ